MFYIWIIMLLAIAALYFLFMIVRSSTRKGPPAGLEDVIVPDDEADPNVRPH